MDTFNNPCIAPQSLPQAALADSHPVSPKLAWLMLVPSVAIGLQALVGAVLLSRFALELDWPRVALCMLAALVLALGYGRYRWLWARQFRYGLRQHDAMVWYGVWWRHHKVVPSCRLQHLSIEQGPLERKAGLATLKGYSAGSAGAELIIPGLTPELAQSLRQQLLEQVEQ